MGLLPPLLPRRRAIAPRPGGVGPPDGRGRPPHPDQGLEGPATAGAGRLEGARRAAARPGAGGWIGSSRRMDAVSRQLQPADPRRRNAPAENVADAAEEARSLAITAQMHAAAGSLQENQIGQVSGQHKQIIEDLQKVLDILANRRRYELSGLVKKQQQAEADAGRTAPPPGRTQQEDGGGRRGSRPRQTQGRLERLAHEQEAIQEETKRMARRLERILAEQAGRSAEQAGQQMGQAGQQAAGGNAAAAARQAAEAAKSLEDARRQLAAQRLRDPGGTGHGATRPARRRPETPAPPRAERAGRDPAARRVAADRRGD